MKLLLTAKWLGLCKTSEGICTSKVIRALAEAGHEVLCLTSDPAFADQAGWFSLPWLGTARVRQLEQPGAAKTSKLNRALNAVSSLHTGLADKLGAAVTYTTGYNANVWQEVARWRAVLGDVVRTEQPDLLYVRGAGLGFEPHLALLQGRAPLPWIAHYHDPFPLSLYPEPYRKRQPLISRRQEALHYEIIRQAGALTFPSQRLLEWVLRGSLARHRAKAYAVPHLAMALPGDGPPQTEAEPPEQCRLASHNFNVVHVGNLLAERQPWGLLEGFLQFIGEDTRRKQFARLVFVGGAHPAHTNAERWQAIAAHPNIQNLNQRVSYAQSLDLLNAAAVAVLLEANAPESPFFPAKLADYLWLDKPILALSPKASVTADLLGADYPLLVSPEDSAGVKRALETAWEKWEDGALKALSPPRAARDQVLEQTGCAKLNTIFAELLRQPITPAAASARDAHWLFDK